MNKLDPSVKTIWSLTILGKYVLFSLIVLFVEQMIILPNMEWFLPSGVLTLVIIGLAVITAIIWPILAYKFWQFDIRTDELYIERGVLTRIKTTAPYSRIQHIDVQQNVLERMFDLSKLVIYTAGTRGADLVIPGLPIEYAEALRDQLKNYTPDEDAV